MMDQISVDTPCDIPEMVLLLLFWMNTHPPINCVRPFLNQKTNKDIQTSYSHSLKYKHSKKNKLLNEKVNGSVG